MKYTKLGRTGMDVSRVCLGGMGFGDPEKWVHKWLLNEEESREVIKRALELGINYFDTANIYSLGLSEEIIGKALKDFANRDEVVLQSKVSLEMFKGPNGSGLSRKHIFSQIDQSLKRLKTDYLDLYVIHRWDYDTPIEETMEALHEIVKQGKVRYIGASSMHTFQFQKANYIAEKNGWTKFVSMQNHLNLIYREEELEMIPYCESEGIALTPYSPLAAGRLAKSETETSKRLETDKIARQKYAEMESKDLLIIERIGELAERYQVSRAEISLAWLYSKPTLAAPIVGATKVSHLETAVNASEVNLSAEDILYLEEPYIPHFINGYH